MPYIAAADAPTFEIPGATFTGLASPSRGSEDNAVWRLTLHPGAPGVPHQLSREEIFVALSGHATASLGGNSINLNPGDALVVPAFTDFSLANASDKAFEAVVVLPAGARGMVEDGAPFVPPWAA